MFVLCVVEPFFDLQMDQTMHRVVRPLQMFESEEDALRASELFYPFYEAIDEPIRVVPADQIDEVFR